MKAETLIICNFVVQQNTITTYGSFRDYIQDRKQ